MQPPSLPLPSVVTLENECIKVWGECAANAILPPTNAILSLTNANQLHLARVGQCGVIANGYSARAESSSLTLSSSQSTRSSGCRRCSTRRKADCPPTVCSLSFYSVFSRFIYCLLSYCLLCLFTVRSLFVVSIHNSQIKSQKQLITRRSGLARTTRSTTSSSTTTP